MFGRWRKHNEEHREGDPRGGEQSETYRHARPDEIVDEDGTAMAGPGGSPGDPLDAEERRERGRAS